MSSKKLLIIILMVAIVGALVFFWLDQADDTNDETIPTNETSQQQEAPDTEEPAEEEPLTVENEYFTLALPAGFSPTDERIFEFTGAPEQHFSFVNEATGDYFEVNRGPAQSGAASDFTWQYEYIDGEFIIQDDDVSLCDPADDWCTTVGDGRLDAALWPLGNIEISGEIFYFTFGNTQSESTDDLVFVDEFLSSLTF